MYKIILLVINEKNNFTPLFSFNRKIHELSIQSFS